MVVHECNNCGKVFKRMDNFKRHLNRKYKCISVSKENEIETEKNKNETKVANDRSEHMKPLIVYRIIRNSRQLFKINIALKSLG